MTELVVTIKVDKHDEAHALELAGKMLQGESCDLSVDLDKTIYSVGGSVQLLQIKVPKTKGLDEDD